MTIGEKIKELRKKNNITQEKLAGYLNISCQAVSKWESNATLPDITYVVPIANFFNISTDTLFDLNSKTYSEEEDLLDDKYLKLRDLRKYSDAIELMKAACFNYPRNYKLLYNQAESLRLNWEENKDDVQINKCIELCERILDDCTDNEVRYLTMQLLVYTYCHLDKKEKAKSIVDGLPNTPICKDLLLERILSGEELEKQLDINLDHFMLYIWLKLQKTAVSKDKRTIEDRILAQRAAIQFYELIFYDGNFGWHSCRVAVNYIKLSKIYAGVRDTVMTIESLSKAVKYAKDFEDSFSQDVFTTSIFRYDKKVSTDYHSEERKDHVKEQLRELISLDIFEFLKGNESFEALKREIEV